MQSAKDSDADVVAPARGGPPHSASRARVSVSSSSTNLPLHQHTRRPDGGRRRSERRRGTRIRVRGGRAFRPHAVTPRKICTSDAESELAGTALRTPAGCTQKRAGVLGRSEIATAARGESRLQVYSRRVSASTHTSLTWHTGVHGTLSRIPARRMEEPPRILPHQDGRGRTLISVQTQRRARSTAICCTSNHRRGEAESASFEA